MLCLGMLSFPPHRSTVPVAFLNTFCKWKQNHIALTIVPSEYHDCVHLQHLDCDLLLYSQAVLNQQNSCCIKLPKWRGAGIVSGQ